MRDVAGRDLEFFRGVPQRLITVAGYVRPTPAFFYDSSEADVYLATPLARIRELLPSRRLYPLRLTPRSGLTLIVATEYRDSDLRLKVGVAVPGGAGSAPLELHVELRDPSGPMRPSAPGGSST